MYVSIYINSHFNCRSNGLPLRRSFVLIGAIASRIFRASAIIRFELVEQIRSSIFISTCKRCLSKLSLASLRPCAVDANVAVGPAMRRLASLALARYHVKRGRKEASVVALVGMIGNLHGQSPCENVREIISYDVGNA